MRGRADGEGSFGQGIAPAPRFIEVDQFRCRQIFQSFGRRAGLSVNPADPDRIFFFRQQIEDGDMMFRATQFDDRRWNFGQWDTERHPIRFGEFRHPSGFDEFA
jgi:hypothetical protein